MVDSYLSVVADDDSVDEKSQQGVLVGGGVVLQQGCGVVVTDGGVLGTLSQGSAGSSQEGKLGEVHD